METSFRAWLRKRDPELAESVLGKAGALGLGMGGAMAGGAAGLLGLPLLGPLAPLAGWMAGKAIGTKTAEKLLPQSTLELMRKNMRKRMRKQ